MKNEPQTITINPPKLPWWRRLLRLGPPAAQIQRDLETAVQIANGNAGLAERLELERRRVAGLWNEAEEKAAARRNVAWPKPAKRMPKAQIAAAFNVPIDEPLFTAIMQEIDDQLQDLLDVVSQPPSPQLTEQGRLHLAGGIEHLRLLQKRILDHREDAQRKAASEAGDDEDDA